MNKYIKRQMVNYANTQLYEIIEHDEDGNAHVYRGQTTQPLHKRLAVHRSDFKKWKEGTYGYCSSFEVLKHGPARIELVRVVSCLNKKEANREEGKFIRELPTCVNILKNLYENKKEYREANKETINAYLKKYREANKDTLYAKKKEYTEANKETIKAKRKEYHETNKETIKAKAKEYYKANAETIKAKAKEYREASEQIIKARRTEKVTCECGAVVSRGAVARHKQTKTHLIRSGELPNETICYIKLKPKN